MAYERKYCPGSHIAIIHPRKPCLVRSSSKRNIRFSKMASPVKELNRSPNKIPINISINKI
jgi:hypothetical protein